MVYFCPLRFVLILANSADHDEMQQYAAFHLGFHCLQKYPFSGFQYTKGLNILMSNTLRQNLSKL